MTIADVIRHVRMRFWLLVRYGTAGAFGAFVQTSALYIWVSVFGFYETYLLGAFLGFCLALAITFLLQKFWTFRDHALHRTRRQLFLYSMVAVVNVVINIVLLALAKEAFVLAGVNFFAGWYVLVQAGIVAAASGVSFLLNYLFTFRNTGHAPDDVLKSPSIG